MVVRETPKVQARNASLPILHGVEPVQKNKKVTPRNDIRRFIPSRVIGTISPQISGASMTSPGPVNMDSDIY